MARILSILMLGSFTLLAQPRIEAPAPKWARFETTGQSALPIVLARMNEGAQAIRLLLDPSVGEVLIDQAIVEGMGVKLAQRGEQARIDYYGRPEAVPVAYLSSLRVGGATLKEARVLLIAGDDATSSDGIPIYGRVGMDFLRSSRLTVYYPRKLYLLEPAPPEVPGGGASFETQGRFITVEVAMAAGVARFVLDPGTLSTIVDRKWAEEQSLVGKDKNARAVELPVVKIGSFETEAVPALLGKLNDLPYDVEAQGVLGASFLLPLAVTYDFEKKLVWFRSGRPAPGG